MGDLCYNTFKGVIDVSIGSNIKNKRIECGFTLEELAKKIGTSKQTIQRYETGIISNIPSDKIEALAHALRTTPAYLMGWEKAANNDESEFDYKSYAETLLAEKDEAYKIALQYRKLDEHGKKIVRNLLESEYKRCNEIEIQIAARDGSRMTRTVNKDEWLEAEKKADELQAKNPLEDL